uniref:Uncharacterized protein n=1 Tax=Solanum tuberosum TaxID=4113 RepID=M1BMF4_SOLTU
MHQLVQDTFGLHIRRPLAMFAEVRLPEGRDHNAASAFSWSLPQLRDLDFPLDAFAGPLPHLQGPCLQRSFEDLSVSYLGSFVNPCEWMSIHGGLEPT